MLQIQLQLGGKDSERPILTSGSVVSGILTCSKVESATVALDVWLCCVVHTYWYRDTGNGRIFRRETNAVIEQTIRLWQDGQGVALQDGATFPFRFEIPAALGDGQALIPSYQHDGHARWGIKAKASRQGTFKVDDRVEAPFVVFPTSGPPAPQVQSLVGHLPLQHSAAVPSLHDLASRGAIEAGWSTHYVGKKLWHNLIFHLGDAVLSSYLPSTSLTRGQRVPFLLVLDLGQKKPSSIMPDWGNMSITVRQSTRITAKGKTDTHARPCAGLTISEVETFVGTSVPSRESQIYTRLPQSKMSWIQQSAIAGTFVFDGIPTFEHPQMSMKYTLRFNLPIPGLSNSVHVECDVQFASGIAGPDVQLTFIGQETLPPAYFDARTDDDEPEKT